MPWLPVLPGDGDWPDAPPPPPPPPPSGGTLDWRFAWMPAAQVGTEACTFGYKVDTAMRCEYWLSTRASVLAPWVDVLIADVATTLLAWPPPFVIPPDVAAYANTVVWRGDCYHHVPSNWYYRAWLFGPYTRAVVSGYPCWGTAFLTLNGGIGPGTDCQDPALWFPSATDRVYDFFPDTPWSMSAVLWTIDPATGLVRWGIRFYQ